MGRERAAARLRVAVVAALLAGCAHAAATVGTGAGVRRHRVERGETLGAIALRYHVAIARLVEANGLRDPDRIQAGSELVVPPTHPGLLLRAAVPSTGAAAPSVVRLDWPALGRVTSLFGVRDGRPHDGIDLALPDGTPVRAAADGEVLYAGDELRGYGRLVIVRHDERLITVYAHNQQLDVSAGVAVVRGQRLALSGHTGRVTAPHLHFEVRELGVPRDPLRYLAPRLAHTP